MSEHVVVETRDAVVRVRLHRPEKKNALTLEMYAAMADALLVTPLIDGMNLVAKEYVACRADNTGAASSDAASDADIVTGDSFTDSAIKQRNDLSQYRILHFATHGLVTAPRPECPAR